MQIHIYLGVGILMLVSLAMIVLFIYLIFMIWAIPENTYQRLREAHKIKHRNSKFYKFKQVLLCKLGFHDWLYNPIINGATCLSTKLCHCCIKRKDKAYRRGDPKHTIFIGD